MVMFDETQTNFITLRRSNRPFVDKTGFIAELLDMRKQVVMITRPRRFGKSMNLSMLDAFLNIEYQGNDWFRGLKIDGMLEYDVHRNAYPVICMDMTMGADSYDSVLNNMDRILSNTFKRFSYLKTAKQLEKHDRDFIGRVIEQRTPKDMSMQWHLLDLCRCIEEYHDIPPVILIDEYDSAMTHAYGGKDGERIEQLIGGLLGITLKNNNHFSLGVVTGVTNVPKQSMFSGLNNIHVNDVSSTDLSEWFGFTHDEVQSILSHDDGTPDPERMAVAKQWYDGYRFGDTEVYNPWSILNYNNSSDARGYWIGMSRNELIRMFLDLPMPGMFGMLNDLREGKAVTSSLDMHLSFSDMTDDPDNILSMMVSTGYLSAEPTGTPGEYRLRIPNLEVYQEFRRMFGKGGESEQLKKMRNLALSISTGDPEEISKSVDEVMTDFFRYGRERYEEGYQAVICACMMLLGDDFEVKGERDMGKGVADIVVRRIKGVGANIVMELKRIDVMGDPEACAEEALLQIKRKGYFRGLKGRTLLYGIALGGDSPKAVMEEVHL